MLRTELFLHLDINTELSFNSIKDSRRHSPHYCALPQCMIVGDLQQLCWTFIETEQPRLEVVRTQACRLHILTVTIP